MATIAQTLTQSLAEKMPQSGETLLKLWQTLSGVPGGKLVFSKLIGRMAPYTGTIDGRVVELDNGYAKVEMKDRKAVRNHLNSVHAVALVNLAEETTGLAMMAGLPNDARGILKGLSIEYIKKARGTLTGECICNPPSTSKREEYEVEGVIKNAKGEVVAKAQAIWLIGPKKG